ncbi:unnamed protein product [Kuraishia capsulata CBS 1993]|uniref:FHA domain-containing protein n=1 Tax=Kuraishia capsulata CBS 1993 TaxID=1382522 RepID=W6MP08_9ASCO|nr:uncharacterized protein KUCA_T00004391001 [Kuraishia capsulata CBS 1993]CDK28409.1 unnamed protein product [Kuraishia capsulata CBS 1993]
MEQTKMATRPPVSDSDKINVNRILQRKRSTSRTQSNYHPIPIAESPAQASLQPPQANSQTQSYQQSHSLVQSEQPNQLHSHVQLKKNGVAKAIPQLQKHVYVVKLVPFESSGGDLLKILNVPVFPETLKIGRQNGPKVPNKITDGYFDSRVLSRTHAELYIKDNLLYLRDLKSSNGTFVNDDKLVPLQEYQLKLEDKIDLGTTLENQLTHKKITCRVAELKLVGLDDYDSIIKSSKSPSSVESEKLELFNGVLDSLIFGDVIDEQDDPVLEAMLKELTDQDLGISPVGPEEVKAPAQNQELVQNLNIKSSSKVEDVIRKLILMINNENLQHQKLSSIANFLTDYTQSIPRTNKKDNDVAERLALEKSMKEEGVRWKNRVNEVETNLKSVQGENLSLKRDLETAQSAMSALQSQVDEMERVVLESATAVKANGVNTSHADSIEDARDIIGDQIPLPDGEISKDESLLSDKVVESPLKKLPETTLQEDKEEKPDNEQLLLAPESLKKVNNNASTAIAQKGARSSKFGLSFLVLLTTFCVVFRLLPPDLIQWVSTYFK